MRQARSTLVCRTRKTRTVVHPAAASGLGRLTLRLDRLGRTVAVVRPPLGHETIGHRAVAIEALGLEVRRVRSADVRPLVPVEAEPAQAVHDSRDHLPRRTFGVGVLDAQHERAAVPAGIQPVEQRRAGAADVQVAGGRRGKADADHVAEGIVPSEPTCRADEDGERARLAPAFPRRGRWLLMQNGTTWTLVRRGDQSRRRPDVSAGESSPPCSPPVALPATSGRRRRR